MKKGIVLVLMAVFVFAGSAFAQDLVGTWAPSDEGWGARSGKAEHKGIDFKGEGWTGSTEMLLKIEKQQGKAFHGQWCGPVECEDLVGVIKTNGQIRMADEDGYFEAEMLGEKMEVCYMEADDNYRIATCKIMKKK